MIPAIFLASIVLVYSQSTTTQCPGTWSDWAPVSGATCSKPCGMCGVIEVQRSCTPAGCLCENPTETTMNQTCGEDVCLYPIIPGCCPPYNGRAMLKGKFICIILPSTTSTTTLATITTTEDSP